ncbi:MAG: glycosyltransferase family 39 protein [Caldilineaceae bacterium]|nr:glycosyltransferase family 39 protein [Caldilineaceae bacterium]
MTLRPKLFKKPVSLLLLGLIVLLAGWLRWRYAQTISLYVDEFTTLWAARRVQMLGVPWMPSGVLYTRGLLATYVEAAFLALFGFSYFIGRLPSLLFGLMTVVALWLVGRRLWREEVGLLAAFGLALLPEAVLWSGRARFYTQLQFFTLLTVWAAFATVAIAPTDKRLGRYQWLFALCFLLALFSHEELVLLYPSLVLGMLLWRGWRFFLRPVVFAAHALCGVGLALRYLMEKVGQPGYFETIQDQRPYVGMIFDLHGAWQTYSPLFLAPDRAIWTVGTLLALVVALWALWRCHGRLRDLPLGDQAILFLLLQLGFVIAVIFTLVGTTWREGRYLFFVQPLWLLVGAAGLGLVLQRLSRYRWLSISALVGLFCVIGVTQLPAAQAVLQQQVEGYDLALAWLATERAPTDVVLSPQPPACALVLGPCDYYAVQRGYEEFVIERDGILVDRWSGATLLTTTAQLAQTIQQAPRTWFVTDRFRLATRYEADFVRTVIEQFAVAYEARGVVVLRADGWRMRPTAPTLTPLTPPLAFGPLTLMGYEWPTTTATTPTSASITLFWQGNAPIHEQLNTSLRLVDQQGNILARVDGPPARGLIPTNLFFDQPLPDEKVLPLPATLPMGLYRFEALAYRAATAEPLANPAPVAWLQRGQPAPPVQRLDMLWQDGIVLVGADTVTPTARAGETVSVRLVWSATVPPQHDYTIFVHWVDASGTPLAQMDRQPLDGFYPTSAWQPGTWVAEVYPLALPATLPAGNYRLLTGLYNPTTFERLPLADGADAALLASVTITE